MTNTRLQRMSWHARAKSLVGRPCMWYEMVGIHSTLHLNSTSPVALPLLFAKANAQPDVYQHEQHFIILRYDSLLSIQA
jgi:hypothetical protein